MEPSRKEKKLTPKQEKFAQAVASGTSLKESAVLAGYSHKNAQRAGAYLANHEPLVKRRIKAIENNAFGAAVTAEINRGKASGLYVDRKELTVNKTSDMSKLQIIERIKELHEQSGGILPRTTYTVEAEETLDIVREDKDQESND